MREFGLFKKSWDAQRRRVYVARPAPAKMSRQISLNSIPEVSAKATKTESNGLVEKNCRFEENEWVKITSTFSHAPAACQQIW